MFQLFPTIRSKKYWDKRINAPSPPIQCCVNDWKEKIQPTFSNIDHGGRGRPTYFKMAKNVKSLIIFARDCLSWSCLGVSCPKYEILPNYSDHVDVKLTYFNQFFCPPKCRDSTRSLRGGLGKNKGAFLTNLFFYYHLHDVYNNFDYLIGLIK